MSPHARRVLALAAALLVVGVATPAAAGLPDPDTRVTVHPGPEVVQGPAETPPEGSYYVTADAHEARTPGPDSRESDCSRSAAAPEPGAPHDQPPRAREWRPVTPDGGGSLRGFTPECAWESHVAVSCVESACALTAVRAAYDVRTGEYNVVATAAVPFVPDGPAAGGLPPVQPTTAAEVAAGASGNTGVGLAFDCEECPTPP